VKKIVSIFILVCFFVTGQIGPCPVYAQEFILPAPGVMVHLSPAFNPPILKGIKVHPDNPFKFDFILDKGDGQFSNDVLKNESSKLIKYFLASLTIPEKDLWVNLSPYEKDRIIPNSFGLTEMGRDLLAEDYMLKQITASLIYPEGETGKKFWKRIYEEASKKFGTTNIPVNTFNKVWIIPEKAVVFENAKAGTAYVVESKLKVMLEQDYLSLAKHKDIQSTSQTKDTNQLGSQIFREIVISELTKEVNEDKNFSQLRQVYNSLILATWYKKKIKDSILEQVYTDRNKVAGVNIDDPNEKEKIYQRYIQAFKKGAYNFIKEERDPISDQPVPRKYFSGGAAFMRVASLRKDITRFPSMAMIVPDHAMVIATQLDRAMIADEKLNDNTINLVFLARIEEYKGVAGFIKLVAYAQRKYGVHVRAYVHGNVTEEYRRNLEDLAKKEGAVHLEISGRYESTQELIDRLRKMERYNTIVVHSYGFVTKEMMAMGFPILSADRQVSTGTYKPYTNGKGAAFFELPGYERALDDLIEHPQKRVELAHAARQVAVEYYGSKEWLRDFMRNINLVNGNGHLGERFVADMTFSGFGSEIGGFRRYYHNLFLYLHQGGIKSDISAYNFAERHFKTQGFPAYLYVPGVFEERNFHTVNTYQNQGPQKVGRMPSEEGIRLQFLPPFIRLLEAISQVDVDMDNIFKVTDRSHRTAEQALDAMAQLQDFFVEDGFDVNHTMESPLVKEAVAGIFTGSRDERLARAEQILYDEQSNLSFHFCRLRTLMSMLNFKMASGKDISLTSEIWSPIINLVHRKRGGPPVIYIENNAYGLYDRVVLKDIENQEGYSAEVKRFMQQYLALLKMIMVHCVDGYINPWNGEKLKQLYGDFFRGKGMLLPHAVDTELFTPGEAEPLVVNAAQIANQAKHLRTTPEGGIDLTPANMNVQTQNVGEGIKFHLDSDMIQRLKDVPGFVPVIINIQPITNLRQFLGLNVQQDSPAAS